MRLTQGVIKIMLRGGLAKAIFILLAFTLLLILIGSPIEMIIVWVLSAIFGPIILYKLMGYP